jgi:hypothetical protein
MLHYKILYHGDTESTENTKIDSNSVCFLYLTLLWFVSVFSVSPWFKI